MPFYDRVDGSDDFQISFARNPTQHFAIFAKGFSRAAHRLAEELLLREQGFRDYEAYPVVFLYRHAFELHLKNVIYSSWLLFAFREIVKFSTRLESTHNLVHLSTNAAGRLRKLFPKDAGLESFLQSMLQVSREFADIDPNSYSYRYPIDKEGKPSTKPNQTVNLAAFSATMKQMIDGLEAVDFGLDMERSRGADAYEMQQEAEQLFREEMFRDLEML